MAAVEKLKASEGGAATIEAADVACGLSLGEYTALCFAGALSFEDGVKITKTRGEAMQAAVPEGQGAMALQQGGHGWYIALDTGDIRGCGKTADLHWPLGVIREFLRQCCLADLAFTVQGNGDDIGNTLAPGQLV